MNYYFLLEDEKSLIKVLPYWLEYMDFKCTRVADISYITNNTYVMQSGQGVTQLITKVLFETIDTIIDNPAKIDSLIVIVDAEELSVENRRQGIYEKINLYKREHLIDEFDFEIKIIVSNCCFETWLLGNREIYPVIEPDENSLFYPYYIHYNVKINDPEYMYVPNGVNETRAKYHFHYLHDALLHKKVRYTKKKPNNVATKKYFNEMVSRMNDTTHICSFRELYEYICSQKSLL